MAAKPAKNFFFRGPISSLAFLSPKLLLATHGPDLLLYNKQSGASTNPQRWRLFHPSHKIQSAEVIFTNSPLTSAQVLVISEKSFKVVSLSGLGSETDPSESVSLSTLYDHGSKSIDKIVRIRHLGDGKFIILFAHNFVELWQTKVDGHFESQNGVQGVNQNPEINESHLLCRRFCSEECILYAGDIRPMEGKIDQMLIASGTVFREILLWTISTQSQL